MNLGHTAIHALLAISFVLTACKKNEDPKPTLLTFKADGKNWSTAGTDDWIFATDESGNLLDIKHFETDQTVVLTSDKVPPGQRVNITLFSDNKSFNGVLTFTSYLGITAGASWTFHRGFDPPPYPPFAGKITLILNNWPPAAPKDDSGFYYFFVSTNQGVTLGEGTPSSASFVLPSTSPIKTFMSSYRNDLPVYTTLMASVGNTYSLDFVGDFKPMEHTLSYDVMDTRQYKVKIKGFEEPLTENLSGGYTLARISSNNPTTPGKLVVGWPDGFAAYETDVQMWYQSGYKSYYKFGTGTANTPFLSVLTTVSNSDYKNFVFTTSADYHLRTTYWEAPNSSARWIVNASPTGIQKFSDIPRELTTKYSILRNATFPYHLFEYTKYLDGFTYEDYIQNLSGDKPYSKEYQVDRNF